MKSPKMTIQDKPIFDWTVSEYFGRQPPRGSEILLGVEIEVEGENILGGKLPEELGSKVWTIHDEPSLRGGMEFVTSRPTSLKGIEVALQDFAEITKEAKLRDSIRTSVHIHLDARTLTLGEVYKVLVAYYLVENLLVHLNGEYREGNLHCLRIKDAEGTIERLMDEIHGGNWLRSWDNEHRYAALNLSALSKFGSLEFRFIKGLTNSKEIYTWCEELVHLIQGARSFDTPSDIMRLCYNRQSLAEFLLKFFSPEFVKRICQHCNNDMLDENIILVYDLVSCLKNSKTKASHRKPNITVFDEDLKKPDNKVSPYQTKKPQHISSTDWFTTDGTDTSWTIVSSTS